MRLLAFCFAVLLVTGLVCASDVSNKKKDKIEQLNHLPKKLGKTPKSIDGVYEISGKDMKSSYTGVAIVKKLDDGRYVMMSQGVNDSGTYQIESVGIRTGDVIAFTWATTKQVSSLTVYTINEDGTLSGRWCTHQAPIMLEKLRKIAPLPKGED